MKIIDVFIRNWQPPGDAWWASVEARPDEPLIEADITMTLSLKEYQELLAKDKLDREGEKS